MKNIISILSTLLISSVAFANISPNVEAAHTSELGWVDEQIRAIIPARVGVAEYEINSLRDPFKYAKPDPVARIAPSMNLDKYFSVKQTPIIVKIAPKPPLVLSLIINSKALISGKWYKVGDSVDGYSVKSIGTTAVTLANIKSVKTLSIKSDNYLKINTK
jgi:hypothetical protein